MRASTRSAVLLLFLPTVALSYVGWRAIRPTPVGALRRLPGIVHHNLGEIQQHRETQLIARLKNPASETVAITAVVPDCGCAKAEDDYVGREIAAGGAIEVIAIYGSHEPGPFERTIDISVSTADDHTIHRRFVYTGTVAEQLVVSPPAIHSDHPGGTYECSIEVAFGAPLQAESVRLHPTGDYDAKLVQHSESQTSLLIRPTCDTARPYAGHAFIRLTSPRLETINVPVRLGVSAEPTLAN